MLVGFIPARGLGGEQSSSRFTHAPSRALESKPWSNRYQPVILSPWLQPPILMRTTQARLAVSSRPASLSPPSRAGYVACTHLLNSSSCLVHSYSPSFHLAEGLTLWLLENGGIQKKNHKWKDMRFRCMEKSSHPDSTAKLQVTSDKLLNLRVQLGLCWALC